MSIPEKTNVLVVGGGPGGSYAACALAREGVDVVVLESEIFPRYHIGESMLPSIRHFFRFIDLDEKFNAHGFNKKIGAAFKLNIKREAFTDFVAAGGPDSYAYNVIRSEADELIFRHAGDSGAKIFDGVAVKTFTFAPLEGAEAGMEPVDPKVPTPSDLGRPVSAAYTKKDGTAGVINFDYLIDASGRTGLLSTKYLKNRKFNKGLKNVADWGYWKGTKKYAVGTKREGSPFFEALQDASGWCWAIPLHNGTMSCGVVQRQDFMSAKKKAMGNPTPEEFYKESMKLAPNVLKILGDAKLVSEIKHASDWSYSASSYASPYARIVGDAGCFIDPYFSSGVHLALASGLSAAMTIQAHKRGDCDERTAMKWHTAKVSEGYTRFLLVVLSALKQIRKQDEPVLSDWDEDGFDSAFAFFRPIIQGTADADVGGKLTQDEISKTVDFCLNAFQHTEPEEREAVLKKVEGVIASGSKPEDTDSLTEDELKILHSIRARQMLRTEDTITIDNFSKDAIDGFAPNLQRGNLTLVAIDPDQKKVLDPVVDLFALVKEGEGIEEEEMQHSYRDTKEQLPIQAF